MLLEMTPGHTFVAAEDESEEEEEEEQQEQEVEHDDAAEGQRSMIMANGGAGISATEDVALEMYIYRHGLDAAAAQELKAILQARS